MASLEQGRLRSKYLRIGTWNVRSIRNKEEEAVREMLKYRLDILGISEGLITVCNVSEI